MLHFVLPLRKPLEFDLLAYGTLADPFWNVSAKPSACMTYQWHSLQRAIHTMMTNDWLWYLEKTSCHSTIPYSSKYSLPPTWPASSISPGFSVCSNLSYLNRKIRLAESILNRCLLFFEIFIKSALQTLMRRRFELQGCAWWEIDARKGSLSNAPILEPNEIARYTRLWWSVRIVKSLPNK